MIPEAVKWMENYLKSLCEQKELFYVYIRRFLGCAADILGRS